jgi:putative tryptophan/tyrosine transport system substrate-binding protein
MIHRRDFITLLGGAAAAWPLAARAQERGRVRWIGVVNAALDDQNELARSAIFEQSLEKSGWTVGRNIAIDYRWGASDLAKARSAVVQVLRLAPDAILVNTGLALTAAQEATRTVPIVFQGISEPVERGFVVSLARPGGNTTGFTNLEATMGGKWIELLKEIAPRVKRVTAIFNPTSSFAEAMFRSAEAASQKLSVEVVAARVHSAAEIEAAVTAVAHESGAGLVLLPDGFMAAHRQQIVGLTARYRLPAIFSNKPYVTDGGLMSYGIDLFDQYRQAAGYVDRILRGEKPADLPVQQPVKFELVINMKTARALGLTVPLTLQVAADEVIE